VLRHITDMVCFVKWNEKKGVKPIFPI
jgi:hypothetical protein